MAELLNLLFKPFIEILKLKESSKYSTMYNKALNCFCESLIEKLDDQDSVFQKLIKFNCLALRAAIEFSTYPNSNKFDVISTTFTLEQKKTFLKSITDQFNYFKVNPESLEDYSAIRLNEIIHLNCKIFIEVFDNSKFQIDIELFDQLIKHLCLILYEIVTPQLRKQHHKCYDVLQQRNSDTIKFLLELKIAALSKYEDEPRKTQKILKIHKNLLKQVTGYLDSIVYE